MALRARGVAAAGEVPVGAAGSPPTHAESGVPSTPSTASRSAVVGGASAQLGYHDCYFAGTASCDAACCGALVVGEPLDPDRARLELGRARLRVGRVDGEDVRLDLVGEVERHERQARAAASGRPARAPSTDPRREVILTSSPSSTPSRSQSSGERSSDSPRRSGERVAAALDAGVVGVEPPAGREPDRELVRELVDGKHVLDDVERRGRPRDRASPTAGRGGRARPGAPRRSTATGSRRAPRAADRSCRRASARASAARSRPTRRRGSARSCPMRAAISQTISMSSRAWPGGSSAFRTRWTRRSLFVTVPSASHQLAEAGSTTSASSAVLVRKMSCTTRWSRPSSSFSRVLRVGLGLGRVLADDVERAQLAALHRLEHLREVPAVARLDRGRPRPARTARGPRGRARCPGSPAACSGSRPCRRRPARCSGRGAGSGPSRSGRRGR